MPSSPARGAGCGAQREHDGGRVGGEVAGVGEQRQRARDPGAHELDDQHGEGDEDPKRNDQRRAGAAI